MNADDYACLEGKIVLVRSARDRRDPPTAIRGTLHVVPAADPAEPPAVEVQLGLPEMFTAPAHPRRFALDREAVAELFRTRLNDTFSCTLDYDFEEDTRGKTAVAPGARGGKRPPSG